jgi:hypothetical protein
MRIKNKSSFLELFMMPDLLTPPISTNIPLKRPLVGAYVGALPTKGQSNFS